MHDMLYKDTNTFRRDLNVVNEQMNVHIELLNGFTIIKTLTKI